MLFADQVNLRPFAIYPMSSVSCGRRGAQCPAAWREAVMDVPIFRRDIEEPRLRAWSPQQWPLHPWVPSFVPIGIRRRGGADQDASGNKTQDGSPSTKDTSDRARPSKTPVHQSENKGTVTTTGERTRWSEKIDMSHFRREDIKVVSVDGGYRVHATSVRPMHGGGVFRIQVSRSVETPSDVDKKTLRIWLGTDGILYFAENNNTSSAAEAKDDEPTVEKQVAGLASQSSLTHSNGKDSLSQTPAAMTTSDSTLQNDDAAGTDPTRGKGYGTNGTRASQTKETDDAVCTDPTHTQGSDTDETRTSQANEISVPVTVPGEKTTDDNTTDDGHDGEKEIDGTHDTTNKKGDANGAHNTTDMVDDAHDTHHRVDTVNETIFKMEELTDVTGTHGGVQDVGEELGNKYDVITMDDVDDMISNVTNDTNISDELPEFVDHVMSNEEHLLNHTRDAAFRKSMDVSGFDPNDLVIKVVDRTVSVAAECQQDVDGVETLRRLSCSFKLPPGVDADSIRSAVTADGNLTIFGHLESEVNHREKIVSIQRVA